tara:strand:- start:37 stop:240 length:204 start_codon:yes stop_codon:yes gene_type:complete
MAKQNKNNQIKDEWVIRLIDASTDVVNGYEKYLLDEIDYTDLAHLMLELKEVLPKGCTEDESENEKD